MRDLLLGEDEGDEAKAEVVVLGVRDAHTAIGAVEPAAQTDTRTHVRAHTDIHTLSLPLTPTVSLLWAAGALDSHSSRRVRADCEGEAKRE